MIILETVAIFLMNRKKYWQLNQSHPYIYFLLSPPNPQEIKQKKKQNAEGQLKFRLVCQCRERDIFWRDLPALVMSSGEKQFKKSTKRMELGNSNLIIRKKKITSLFTAINLPRG